MTSHTSSFHSNGKLLLSAEYFVLDGALALALPTCLGQSIHIKGTERTANQLFWKSFDEKGVIWFEGQFQLPDVKFLAGTNDESGRRLEQLFKAIERQRPRFWESFSSLEITTELDFPRLWGLGTSSTLIAGLSAWANVDPYQLLADTFGGSGYDIACAKASGPILYQLEKGKPYSQQVAFNPPFTKQLYFVYLGKKQNSREGIAHYRQLTEKNKEQINRVTKLTSDMAEAKSLPIFEELMDEHEYLISEALQLPRVGPLYFPDFWGKVKSLGAWGGDFVLMTNPDPERDIKSWLKGKGFRDILSFSELILIS